MNLCKTAGGLPMKRIAALLLTLTFSSFSSAATDSFKICWSIYVGWMPWGYGAEQKIVDKWAKKYDLDIEVVQINDYIESINQYTTGEFAACAMTNMDALTIPAAGGVDSTALIVGDFSNGNDGVVLKGYKDLKDIKGQKVNLVELSVSHYLLARGLESVGMSESDVTVVNTSDADMVAVFPTAGVTSVATWNPLLSEIMTMPGSNKVFDSSQIPGEIIDLLVIKAGVAARTEMGTASGTDLAGYESQLASTKMFYTPASAVEFTNSAALKTTMKNVAEFSFAHGLLGDGAPDAGFIGIETPAGVYGNSENIKFRFDPSYMQMAADGKL